MCSSSGPAWSVVRVGRGLFLGCHPGSNGFFLDLGRLKTDGGIRGRMNMRNRETAAPTFKIPLSSLKTAPAIEIHAPRAEVRKPEGQRDSQWTIMLRQLRATVTPGGQSTLALSPREWLPADAPAHVPLPAIGQKTLLDVSELVNTGVRLTVAALADHGTSASSSHTIAAPSVRPRTPRYTLGTPSGHRTEPDDSEPCAIEDCWEELPHYVSSPTRTLPDEDEAETTTLTKTGTYAGNYRPSSRKQQLTDA